MCLCQPIIWSMVAILRDSTVAVGAEEANYCKDDFSFVLVEAPTNFNCNSLKVQFCSGEDVLAVLSAGFLKITKTTKVLECFRSV